MIKPLTFQYQWVSAHEHLLLDEEILRFMAGYWGKESSFFSRCEPPGRLTMLQWMAPKLEPSAHKHCKLDSVGYKQAEGREEKKEKEEKRRRSSSRNRNNGGPDVAKIHHKHL